MVNPIGSVEQLKVRELASAIRRNFFHFLDLKRGQINGFCRDTRIGRKYGSSIVVAIVFGKIGLQLFLFF